MGFLDWLFGRREEHRMQPSAPTHDPSGRGLSDVDEQALQRYRYMLRTAPPETIEQAHAEAFAQLTPEQRQMVLQELSKNLPEQERRAGQYSDDPQSLARMATRAELRQPGTIERTFGGIGAGGYGMGGGIGLGGLMAGTFFSSFAGMMIGGMVANAFFGGFGHGGYNEGFAEGYQEGEQNADNADTTDTGGADASQDGQGAEYAGADQYAGGDTANYDMGDDTGMADYGSSGGGWGDLGGGDFGGDFGGGDFGGDFGF